MLLLFSHMIEKIRERLPYLSTHPAPSTCGMPELISFWGMNCFYDPTTHCSYDRTRKIVILQPNLLSWCENTLVACISCYIGGWIIAPDLTYTTPGLMKLCTLSSVPRHLKQAPLHKCAMFFECDSKTRCHHLYSALVG